MKNNGHTKNINVTHLKSFWPCIITVILAEIALTSGFYNTQNQLEAQTQTELFHKDNDMKPIESISKEECKKIRGIFCDIDDTITTGGKLLDASYHALWRAHNAGLKVVPVTGRPAGWVDHMARMWPVDAVVGENGAFYFWMQDGKMARRYIQDAKTRSLNRIKLFEIRDKVLARFPKAGISADQNYREIDVAIDFCEDVPPLPMEDVNEIAKIFKQEGANVKISSIHVNAWFGEHDKLTTCRLLIKELFKEDEGGAPPGYIFIGDSPNDEPMFAGFSLSAGVANINKMIKLLKHKPVYVTRACGGEGFAEFVDTILKLRE